MEDNPMVSIPSPIENNPNMPGNTLPNTEVLQETTNTTPEVIPAVENKEPIPTTPVERIDKDIENLRNGRELSQLSEGEKSLLAELMRQKNILLETPPEESIPQDKPKETIPIPGTVMPPQQEYNTETPPMTTGINTNNYNPEEQEFIKKLSTSMDASL